MEDLLLNDASFEVYSNSDGARILARNRMLMDYPDEKNSFDVFLGFTDTNNDGKDDTTGKTKEEMDKEKKPKKPIFTEENLQKGASLLTSGVQTGQSVVGAVKSFQTQEKKSIKEKCGRKPLLKKNRKTYDACVQDYMNSLGGTNTPVDAGANTGGEKFAPTDEPPKKNKTTTYVIIGVVAVALIGGLIYLKKTGKI
jgi:hypothetical protein